MVSEKKSKFHDLLLTEMTRKEFIVRLGVLLISVFGFSNIVEFLSKPHETQAAKGSGFGNGGFGT